ncbi:Bardet-Biedl syndrome 2 protein [Planoprotostelium fungivorum]|uniref:Bardet-Biedl syndrome 2 protein n=1 Tax=Planoprotostelium fungivorum TaxID=1890364 RepID=A0A2P6NGP3_9EUKA|nr:Bardet-Biedl syndrome 2 protein [Planoprotostelium fungivorum]
MYCSTFKFSLGTSISEGLVTVGRFDGVHPSIACATTAGRILVHDPHHKPDDPEVRYLNINQTVSGLGVGALEDFRTKQYLFVGTQTNLLGYDVEANTDIFFKEVPDGVNTMVVGSLGENKTPMCIVGGNCTIQGFDPKGEEIFYTITGDNVSSLALGDVLEEGNNNLIVGSEDFELRVFKGEEVNVMLGDINIDGHKADHSSYGLENGTVGVYEGTNRLWRAKTKHRITALHSFDLNGDGISELLCGWSSGRFEVRSMEDGSVLYSDELGSCIAAIVISDYRMDGQEQVVCVTVDGEVRGYNRSMGEAQAAAIASMVARADEEQIQHLSQAKQELLQQLKNLEDNIKAAESVTSRSIFGTPLLGRRDSRAELKGKDSLSLKKRDSTANLGRQDSTGSLKRQGSSDSMQKKDKRGSLILRRQDSNGSYGSDAVVDSDGASESQTEINRNASVSCQIFANYINRTVVLSIQTSPGVFIRCVSVFGEQIFEEEAIMIHPKTPTEYVEVVINPKRNASAQLFIKTIVGTKYSVDHFHVFEEAMSFPRFALYAPVTTVANYEIIEPSGYVVCHIADRVNRILLWVNENFLINHPLDETLNETFLNFKTGVILTMKMKDGEFTLRTDDIEVAGEMIQDLCEFLQLSELESQIHFPKELVRLQESVNRVTEFDATRTKLTVAMADSANLIKTLVVRAEDARILSEIPSMKRFYRSLMSLNEELCGEYAKRVNNFNALLDCLKETNQIIQQP